MVSVILTICSLIFTMLLLSTYFSQHQYNTIRNKIYKYIAIVLITLLITEIIACIYNSYGDSDLILLILFKLHWLTGMIWFPLLYYYFDSHYYKRKANTVLEVIKQDNLNKCVAIFSIISTIIFIVLPLDISLIKIGNYIPGASAYYMLLFGGINIVLIAANYYRSPERVTDKMTKNLLFVAFELITVATIQLAFPNIAFFGICAALNLYLLYFFVENPDLERAEELTKLKGSVEKSSRAKSDFLSNMSHEIRSPMNAIVGFSESLLSATAFDEEEARNDIQNIYTASYSLLEIVNNILNVSKIETSDEVLEEKKYNLKYMISELANIATNRIGNKNVKLIIDADENLPVDLYGDATKVRSVLLNIITNAVKYTEVGKIKIVILGSTVGNYVDLKFKISDTGYGIKKEDYDKLFEKFSRLNDATKNSIEGTGLGMVITKRYVDLMGGQIWFESEYEVGTTFYINLRQSIVGTRKFGDINDEFKPDKKIEIIDCSKYRILIVDDNKLNLNVSSKILSKYKFQIDTVDNGKDCIYKIKSDIHYDMIFLDHMMDEMDGLEVLHILKKFDVFDVPPIVCLTANAISGMREMYLNEGFDEYLSKPIDTAELNRIILKYFKDKK